MSEPPRVVDAMTGVPLAGPAQVRTSGSDCSEKTGNEHSTNDISVLIVLHDPVTERIPRIPSLGTQDWGNR